MHHSCGNGSCCSPSKLWRQLQTIVRTGNEQDFERLCGEGRAPHVARVLLSQRLVNDPALYPASNKHRVLQLNLPSQRQQPQVIRLFGTSVRDLNALQMALFLRHETMARSILEFLKVNSTSKELCQFVNHTWGQKNSSLHLAAYWGMTSLVRLLLECGADTTLRNARQRGPLDGCTNLTCIQLLQPSQSPTITTTTKPTCVDTNKRHQSTTTTNTATTAALPRTSMLLKKAVQHVAELPLDALLTDQQQQQQQQQQQHCYLTTPMKIDNSNAITNATTINNNKKPPLVFSSSTSSSSFSSLSSLDEPASPGLSSLLLSSPKTPTPTDLVFLGDGYHGNQQKHQQQQQSWMPASPISPPLTPLSPDYNGEEYNNRDGNQFITSFSPNPMDQPTPICYRHLLHPPPPLRSPPPPIRSPSMDDDDDDEEEATITPTNDMIINSGNLKSTLEIKNRSKSPKSVRFTPDVVLTDICARGDVDDLLHQIKQHQKLSSKSASVILKEWQQLVPSQSSVLHLALLNRQEKMAKCLISLGVDVNATDQDGWAPLHYASILQLWSTVEVLSNHPDILLHAKTNNGLKVYDCPRALVDQRLCRTLVERAIKRQQQQQQQQNHHMTDLTRYSATA
ncbi:hypothetical protein BC941DRAFT_511776 [Chlamydoabsidia padenii]|nr:hypothetical protein BC941DRAFT_511776 [Chlamydoabsidia padenii]